MSDTTIYGEQRETAQALAIEAPACSAGLLLWTLGAATLNLILIVSMFMWF